MTIQTTEEFEKIVEYSYYPKQQQFVVRFLDGSSYAMPVKDLPKKFLSKKPDWENTLLSDDKTGIVTHTKKEDRIIPAFVIHANGTPLR